MKLVGNRMRMKRGAIKARLRMTESQEDIVVDRQPRKQILSGRRMQSNKGWQKILILGALMAQSKMITMEGDCVPC